MRSIDLHSSEVCGPIVSKCAVLYRQRVLSQQIYVSCALFALLLLCLLGLPVSALILCKTTDSNILLDRELYALLVVLLFILFFDFLIVAAAKIRSVFAEMNLKQLSDMLPEEFDMAIVITPNKTQEGGSESSSIAYSHTELMPIAVSLLDYLSCRLGCTYLSDLRNLSSVNRLRVLHLIEGIPADAESLSGWNDALEYLLQEPPAQSTTEAKARLIDKLSI